MKNLAHKVTLQTKILIMVITLILVVITMLLCTYAFFDYRETFNNKRELGLQTAKTISYMDYVEKAFATDDPSIRLQPLAEQIQSQVKASFVLIVDKEGKILSHPDPNQIGLMKEINEEYKALVFGGYYSKKSAEIIAPSVIGVSPIIDTQKNMVVGAVIVGYLNEVIYSEVSNRTKVMLLLSTLTLLLSIVFSVILARSIRRDTFGMEPFEIATLYRDRNTIFSSMREGVIAIDSAERITLMNEAAQKTLNIFNHYKMKPIRSLIPELTEINFTDDERNRETFELYINNTPIILNVVPLKGGKNGYVLTVIDKTEIKQVRTALAKVQKYSEDLRAQTHEFSNKLYVVSGLIQLKRYDKAIEMIQNEIEINEYSNRLIFEQIKDANVQAILLGKIGKASELKVTFTIEEDCSLENLPDFIQISQLTIILGNLLDNAFEAVINTDKKEVTFFAIDIGDDIIFEISDTGPGLSEHVQENLFVQGYSTKEEENRGFGLKNVHDALHELNGFIEVQSSELGTTFIVYIPKRKGDSND